MFLIGNTTDRLKNKYHIKARKSKKSHSQGNVTKANIVLGLSASTNLHLEGNSTKMPFE